MCCNKFGGKSIWIILPINNPSLVDKNNIFTKNVKSYQKQNSIEGELLTECLLSFKINLCLLLIQIYVSENIHVHVPN